MFHDEAEIFLIAGKGGDGAVSFRREKYVPRGGPDGGDGGRGGDVFITANRQLSDLNHYSAVNELRAKNGVNGGAQKRTGADGGDLVLEVPIGTRVFRENKKQLHEVADLTHEGMKKKLLTGGIGGLGNVHFATATHQTPKEAQHGRAGEQNKFRFELQLIADVGIIGLPNAGKSTFLSIVSEAKPKIANYPFTTVSPVLGVVNHHEERLVMADIPGLIEGAAQGKGLGHQFLRHIRRTKVLVHFVDSLSNDYSSDFTTILDELKAYDPELLQKPQIVVVTKAELFDDNELFLLKWQRLEKTVVSPAQLFELKSISAVTGKNIPALLETLAQTLKT